MTLRRILFRTIKLLIAGALLAFLFFGFWLPAHSTGFYRAALVDGDRFIAVGGARNGKVVIYDRDLNHLYRLPHSATGRGGIEWLHGSKICPALVVKGWKAEAAVVLRADRAVVLPQAPGHIFHLVDDFDNQEVHLWAESDGTFFRCTLDRLSVDGKWMAARYPYQYKSLFTQSYIQNEIIYSWGSPPFAESGMYPPIRGTGADQIDPLPKYTPENVMEVGFLSGSLRYVAEEHWNERPRRVYVCRFDEAKKEWITEQTLFETNENRGYFDFNAGRTAVIYLSYRDLEFWEPDAQGKYRLVWAKTPKLWFY